MKIDMNRKVAVELTRREAELLSLAMAEALFTNRMLKKYRKACERADKKVMDAINRPVIEG